MLHFHLIGILLLLGTIFSGVSAGQPVHRPLKVAHRGGAGLAPENTLAAFRKALELRVDAVELDVHLSKDGAVVVMHDPEVSRTTDGSGEIGRLTLAELRTLNAAARFSEETAPQRIPTLDEVLDLVKGKAEVQIEIKRRSDKSRYAGIEEKVLEAVRLRDMLEDVVIISFDFPTLQRIKVLEPQIRTCALVSTHYFRRLGGHPDPALVVADLQQHGFRCVGIKHTWLTAPLLKALHTQGFQVGVWTVNVPFLIREFAGLGVDFLTSDRPDLLNTLLP
ncbi:MAG: glycerophosphodiester phosphodiesterase [Nitrospinota bacterium]|nr:MAG: glycerophosphodiester phosphodiesterase [Nitrospinota bacterium]